MSSKRQNAKFAAILASALAAGAAAGAAMQPMAMVVADGQRKWFVSEGACGFGWVSLAGNTAFGRWAKANGHARPGYPTGLTIWSHLMTQSIDRNEAWANAVARVLSDNGISAYGQSRLD